MILFYQLILGFFFSSIAAVFAYLLKLLTLSGLLAAVLCGTLVIGFGPWYSIFIVGFLLMSSSISHLLKSKWQVQKDSAAAKGNQRDALQLLANLGVSIFSLVLFYFFSQRYFLFGFAAGIAGSAADTLASELGVLNKRPPRNILTGKKISAGLSGGVSPLGFFASFLGSSLIILSFMGFLSFSKHPLTWQEVILLVGIGFLCSVIDSLLGAVFQVRYQCQVCQQLTEKKVHHQLPTQKIHGLSWMTNDTVNFLSSCLTVLLTWLCFYQ